ncbi:hypothetical protein PROFUN_09361 [Planoprotostelium fungivorum]|uniref:V-type proton ATPase proteolipid subunit n=1 Tax=Planoprotostelium fungivorum TaxID=1890364 RepID=A0A2P6NGX0_9EUKA|nr:hypothetical protein PROFUN_09361 [Planoprotostelium fungivorum]
MENNTDPTSTFFGFAGAAMAVLLTATGAAYGTGKSGVSIAAIGVRRPDLVMRSIIPVVMAGVIAIYGLIIGVIISSVKTEHYTFQQAWAAFAGGLCVGTTGLVSGYAVGVVGDAGVRSVAHQPRLFVGMILVLIFAEALALYGLIVALILCTSNKN